LDKRQVFRFHAQAEQSFKRVPKCIHKEHCIAAKSLVERIQVLVPLA
jgi:hypothetical protein